MVTIIDLKKAITVAKIVYRGVKIHTDFKLLFEGYGAITLFGEVWTKYSKDKIQSQIDSPNTHTWTKVMVNHELFHIDQGHSFIRCKWLYWLSWIVFYVLYLYFWIKGLFKYGSKSYYNIPFEREAYANENDMNYWVVSDSNPTPCTRWKDYTDRALASS